MPERFLTTSADYYMALLAMLGTFDTPEEAHRVYRKAHIELHGEQSCYWSHQHEI